MMEAGFAASRFLHFTAVLILFGTALFPFYAWPGRVRPQAARLLRAPAIAMGLLALVSGGLWFVFAVDNMAGISAGLPDPDSVRYVLWQTDFGWLWTARAAIAVLTVFLIAPRPNLVAVLLSAVLLASLAGTGHAQIGSDAALHQTSDALHLLAAGAWIGGLASLAAVCRRGSPDEAATALTRFSGMGYAAVAVLTASGVINAWFLLGSIPNLVDTNYGRTLLIKLALFCLMLGLAGLNRFVFVPRLSQGARETALSHMKRSVYWEQAVGFGVVAVVALLGTTPPPAG